MAPSSDNPPFEFSFRTREASWSFLKNNPKNVLNVVIIGGGIVGAGFLRELSLQGCSDVFLFEKGDFASGTSSASSKLIHAGIRYLEQVWIHLKKANLPAAWKSYKFVAEASRERKTLGDIAPNLIKPKPIYLVLGESDQRSALSVMAGVWLYWAIQITQGQFFSPPRTFFRKDALAWAAPELDTRQVKAIFSFWDSETDDARLVIQNLQAATRDGGQALNYVELISYEPRGEIVLVELQNRETGEIITVQTKSLINATGPWIDSVRSKSKQPQAQSHLIDKVAGAHLDVYPAISKSSYYITASDGRLVFVLARNEDGLLYSRIGTTERPLTTEETPDGAKPTPAEIDYLKGVVAGLMPKANLSDDCIIRLDEGIRPLRSQQGHDAFNKSREHDIILDGRVVHVVGVKLTDFRRVSEELLRTLPWQTWGIPVQETISSERSPLEIRRQERIYPETSMADVVNTTMPLHWEDVVARRGGLKFMLERKTDPMLFAQQQKEFLDALK